MRVLLLNVVVPKSAKHSSRLDHCSQPTTASAATACHLLVSSDATAGQPIGLIGGPALRQLGQVHVDPPGNAATFNRWWIS